MAIVDIAYDCGCGFRRKTVEEAIKHADAHKHTVNVFGTVRPSEPRVPKDKTPSRQSALRSRTSIRVPATTPADVRREDRIDFNNLRAKIRRV